MTATPMSKQAAKRAVLVVASSLDGLRVAAMRKKGGPASIIGKYNFPGGGQEPTDPSPAHAAQRELAEETNMQVDLSSLVHVCTRETDNGLLDVYFAAADHDQIRSLTDESIVTMAVDSTMEMARGRFADDFAPDWAELLELCSPHFAAQREHWASKSAERPALIPCMRSDFRQCIDHERPFVLLDTDENGIPYKLPVNRRGQLRYRYTDTGEEVLVPNTHYNQTAASRARQVLSEAEKREERVVAMRKSPPADFTPWMVENICERLLANAAKIRGVAARIATGELPWDAPWHLVSEASPSVREAQEHEARAAAAAMTRQISKPTAAAKAVSPPGR